MTTHQAAVPAFEGMSKLRYRSMTPEQQMLFQARRLNTGYAEFLAQKPPADEGTRERLNLQLIEEQRLLKVDLEYAAREDLDDYCVHVKHRLGEVEVLLWALTIAGNMVAAAEASE